MSGIFQTWATFIEYYNVLPVSSASAE